MVSDETVNYDLVPFHGLCHNYIANRSWNVFSLFLTFKNARKLGKLAKFFLVVRGPTKFLGKMTLKRSSEIQKFSQENVEISLVVCEPRQNLSSGPRLGKGWEPLA